MPPDGFAVEDQRSNRLAELPDELAAAIGLALVDLGTLGVDGHHRHLAGRSNGIGHLRARERAHRCN
jgi:hypothetical protein